MDFTSRIGLNKPNPDPVTGDVVDVAKLNENADKIDGLISATPCTSGTRPAAPFQGQIIAETDTLRTYIRIGGSWIQIPTTGTGDLLADLNSQRQIQVTRAAASDHAFRSLLTGDTQQRFVAYADGKLEWGPGGATGRDTNLYRRAANHLGTDDSFQAGGYCSGAATESVRTTFVNFSVEQVIQTVTFNAVSGAGYMIYATQHAQGNTANAIIRTRLRYATGASVTTGGTVLTILNPNADVINRGQPITIAKLFVAPSTGQFTVGVTMEATTGTGQSYGDPNQAYNTITVVGA